MASADLPPSGTRPVSVVVADDQSLVRMGLRLVLEGDDAVRVVGEAGDGASAVERCRELRPDVALLDVQMPRATGLQATARILESSPHTRVIILTTFDLDEYVYDALRAGASGFLLKDAAPAELLSAVHAVAAGEAVIAPRITRRLLERFAPRLPDPASPSRPDGANHPRLATLTARELDVLRLVAQGLSNAEIADQLFLSPTTVKSHVSSLLAKLQARDRVHAVIVAYETGLA